MGGGDAVEKMRAEEGSSQTPDRGPAASSQL